MRRAKEVIRVSSPQARARMKSTPQRDTPGELRLRKALHAMGFRYRVDTRPLRAFRGRADIVFRAARVAVFIDGCFWHGCPIHGTWPRANAKFWRAKIRANQVRDRTTDRRLIEHGWAVVRCWEHEDLDRRAAHVAKLVKSRAPVAS